MASPPAPRAPRPGPPTCCQISASRESPSARISITASTTSNPAASSRAAHAAAARRRIAAAPGAASVLSASHSNARSRTSAVDGAAQEASRAKSSPAAPAVGSGTDITAPNPRPRPSMARPNTRRPSRIRTMGIRAVGRGTVDKGAVCAGTLRIVGPAVDRPEGGGIAPRAVWSPCVAITCLPGAASARHPASYPPPFQPVTRNPRKR